MLHKLKVGKEPGRKELQLFMTDGNTPGSLMHRPMMLVPMVHRAV